jgi:hypothetical protein
MLTESILNTEIRNKGFAPLDVIFKENGWRLTKNEMSWICYEKFGHESDVFDIKIDAKSIHVSIPLKNSPFNYVTIFTDYFNASEYIESKLKELL